MFSLYYTAPEYVDLIECIHYWPQNLLYNLYPLWDLFLIKSFYGLLIQRASIREKQAKIYFF